MPTFPKFSQDTKTIALVGIAHTVSHFFHLIIAPLFPWLGKDFVLNNAELGLLMTVFFVVSGIGQAAAGFIVDKFGPRPVLLMAMAGFVVAALLLSVAPNYWVLILGMALAGACNSVFHPVDFSILNGRISPQRLGYAFTVHGVSGSLGWALATGLLVFFSAWLGWRHALQVAALLAAVVWLLLWWGRAYLDVVVKPKSMFETPPTSETLLVTKAINKPQAESIFAFLKLTNIWLCFGFFYLSSMGLSSFQAFGATLLKKQYGYGDEVASQIVTLYLVCAAVGMVIGGWLVARIPRNDTQIAIAYGLSALGAFCIAINCLPATLALGVIAFMGFSYGLATPSRDMLIKRTAPKGAVGRVYGVVYSGADVGFSVGPVVCGWLIDHHLSWVIFFMLAVLQLLAIACAYTVGNQHAKKTKTLKV